MSKGLEALENVKQCCFEYQQEFPNIEQVKYIGSCFMQLEQDLDRLEELEKKQDIEISNLEFIESPNKYQTSIRVLKEAFIELGRGDIANTCWFKYLEELVDKEKPMKPKTKKYGRGSEWVCPNCKSHIAYFDELGIGTVPVIKYCRECGQRLNLGGIKKC